MIQILILVITYTLVIVLFWKDFFFFIKLFNLHYTNKQRTYNTEIKNIYKKITTHALKLMNYFKSHKVVKITTNRK